MTRLQVAAPLLAAAALAAVAVATVQGAGCEDPGRYVAVGGGGYELVGSCITAADLVVTEQVSPAASPASAGATPQMVPSGFAPVHDKG